MATLALAEAPTPFGPQPLSPPDETSLHRLVHELRQPLSAIESIAYYLELITPADQIRVHHQLARIQQLLAQAGTTLSDAVRNGPSQ